GLVARSGISKRVIATRGTPKRHLSRCDRARIIERPSYGASSRLQGCFTRVYGSDLMRRLTGVSALKDYRQVHCGAHKKSLVANVTAGGTNGRLGPVLGRDAGPR